MYVGFVRIKILFGCRSLSDSYWKSVWLVEYIRDYAGNGDNAHMTIERSNV